jgi:ferredoxin
MAKVTVDESLCTGCGLCASSCPEVFEVGDDNIAHVIGGGCTSCDLREIASQCPVEAIALR